MSSRKIALIGVLILLTAGIVMQLANAIDAVPSGVTNIDRGVSTTFNGSLYPAQNTSAEAGNITEINLTARGPTRFWQGFYGEVRGEIVLEDTDGNTLYNWTAAEPQGQIFATTSTAISWLNVTCLTEGAGSDVNWSTEEAKYDMADDDADGITETFTQNNHPDFYIANNLITGCNTTWTMIGNVSQTNRFPMLILEEDVVNDATLYTTFLENRDNGNSTDVTGFDGRTHDFQFMVPENGTDYNRETTTYFFYVSIT